LIQVEAQSSPRLWGESRNMASIGLDVPMSSLVEQVLPFRSSKYTEDFCEKMLGEGIAAPADLLKVSKEALETKMSTHASFNFIEMADVISLRKAMSNVGKDNGTRRDRTTSPEQRRQRSRSNERGRGRKRANSAGKAGGRNNSRPTKGNSNQRNNSTNNNRNNKRRQNQDREEKEKPEKPELWAAVARNDDSAVQQILARGADAEETHDGWTPLMKAAEEGAVGAMRMLLDKKVNLESANKKGRTALSFAAAPSDNGGERRETPVIALRLLLESGADPKRQDVRGMSAKDYAVKAKREEAVSIFNEFAA